MSSRKDSKLLEDRQLFNAASCPALWPACALIAGIFLASFLTSETWAWICFAILSSVFLFCLFMGKRLGAIIFMSLSAGFITAWIQTPVNPPGELLSTDNSFYLVGRVEKTVLTENSVTVLTEIDSYKIKGKKSISTCKPFVCSATFFNSATASPPVSGNRICFFTEELKKVPAPLEFPGDKDLTSFYKSNRITASCTLYDSDIIVLDPTADLAGKMSKIRDCLTDIIYNSPLNHSTAFFIASTLLGDDTYLSDVETEKFRSIGLAHMLALSGFHLALIIWVLSLALYPLRLSGRYARKRYLMIIAAIWAYCLVTGMLPSVTRAGIIATLMLGGRYLQRRSNPFNSLAWAAILILIFSPYTLYSPGFQLSFLAVAAIVSFSSKLNPFPNKRWPRLHNLASIFTVPVSAMLGTLPLVLFYFHEMPLWFLVSNLQAVWLFPLLLFGGVLLISFGVMNLYPVALIKSLDFLYSLMMDAGDLIASFPMAKATDIYPDIFTIVLALFTIASLAFWLHLRGRNLAFVTVILVLATVTSASVSFSAATPLTEAFNITTGKSHTIIARSGTKAVILSDCPEYLRTRRLKAVNNRAAKFFSLRDCDIPDTVYPLREDFNDKDISYHDGELIFADGNKIQFFFKPVEEPLHYTDSISSEAAPIR